MVHQRIFQTTRRTRRISARPFFRPPLLGLFIVFFCSNAVAQKSPFVDLRIAESFERRQTVIVDLRDGSHQARSPRQRELLEKLGEHGEFHFSDDTELRSLLENSSYSPARNRGQDALKDAAASFGDLDCGATEQHASRALLDLAMVQADGQEATGALTQAYLFRFLCADREANTGQAAAAVAALRILNNNQRPKEVSEFTWQKYPEPAIDSVIDDVLVTFESTPPTSTIWIDHKNVGTTPNSFRLTVGPHLVAMSTKTSSVSRLVDVSGNETIQLSLKSRPSNWLGLADTIEEVRTAFGPVREVAMRDLMAAVEAEVAFVLRNSGKIEIWILTRRQRNALLVDSISDASRVGKLANRAIEKSLRGPGLDPDMPLLREQDDLVSAPSGSRRWWIYGIVLTAAAVGAGVILYQELGNDTQRIEVSLP